MSVPSGEVLCRFLKPSEWSKGENRPKPGAFKSDKDGYLSVYHRDGVQDLGDQLATLCFGSLSGFGQVHYTAGEFVQLAQGLEDEGSGEDSFTVAVEWRPDLVPSDWERWSEAHAQVETAWGDLKFPKAYRDRLSLGRRWQAVIPPA